MTPRGERFLLILLVVGLIALLLFAASSCQTRYQPMGEDIWRAL